MNNPLWSVTIPTYNASTYLRETLESVLLQDPGNEEMEIIIVDNCSTDDTIEIVKSIGGTRIKLIVNEKNLGAVGNFNRCVEVASGKLIHLLNADDLVNFGFYQKFKEVFEQNPEVHLVCCNAELIDEHGVSKGQTTAMASLQMPSNDVREMLYVNRMRTPSVVVRKRAYEKIGGFDAKLPHLGDWDMWLRVIHNFKGIYISDVLSKYREHSNNESARERQTGGFILEQDKLFHKFVELNYPITQKDINKYMYRVSGLYYMFYYYANNQAASNNMLNLYKKYAPAHEVFFIVNKVKIKKALSVLKKKILGRP